MQELFLCISHILGFLGHAEGPVEGALATVIKFEDFTMEGHLGAEYVIGLLYKKHERHLKFLYRTCKAGRESHFL